MGEKKSIEAIVSGGKATAGPPLGPALGPLGVNVSTIVTNINERTKDFAGMKVPVTVTVDVDTKEFQIDVGTPPTAALIAKELGIEKGSGASKTQKAGDITMVQIAKVATMKIGQSYAFTAKAAAKELLGSCLSMGITVEGRDPKDVIKEIQEGKHDSMFTK
ncbi:MAG: 50S ribosomal protein L11 [Candidatus Bathyarchaeia archaeon]